jgi:protocatechuate 3,4-dioxygenase beta subunit
LDQSNNKLGTILSNNTRNNNNNHNNNRKKKNEGWTAYKRYPRSVCITIYDMQGNPISDNIVERIINHATESIKGEGLNSLAIAVNKG